MHCIIGKMLHALYYRQNAACTCIIYLFEMVVSTPCHACCMIITCMENLYSIALGILFMHMLWPLCTYGIKLAKRLLLQINEQHNLLHDSTHKFCVSFVAINTTYSGLEKFVAAWNSHPIPSM